jgi:hypothetical protein
METLTHNRPRPVVTQVQNNTSLWIGHLQTEPTEHYAGQIFECPVQGRLDNIQIYSSTVQLPGDMVLSLHQFDAKSKQWGPALGTATVAVEKNDEEKWIRFSLPAMSLMKNETYGFRLHANNAMVAIGEAASANRHPFAGHEWHADSRDRSGHYYKYFSLAFKVEMSA